MACDERLSAMDSSGLKTNLAVNSIGFCQALHCECNVRLGFGGGGGHIVIIPLSLYDNDSRRVLASFKSVVSNPSVNQL